MLLFSTPTPCANLSRDLGFSHEDPHGNDAKNPLTFFAVKQRIEASLSAHYGRFVVVPLPNITDVFYGRDVGYNVERLVLDEETEAISATKIRKLSTVPEAGARR